MKNTITLAVFRYETRAFREPQKAKDWLEMVVKSYLDHMRPTIGEEQFLRMSGHGKQDFIAHFNWCQPTIWMHATMSEIHFVE